MNVIRTATAWDLIGFPLDATQDQQWVRVRGGRTLYEAVIFNERTGGYRVKLSRLEVRRGGLRQVDRYVDPDVVLEVLGGCDCMTERDPLTGEERVLQHSGDCSLNPDNDL